MASPYLPEHAGEEEATELVVKARFTAPSFRTLTQLAAATHVATSDVMRDALSVYWWLARECGAGSRLLVQRGSDITELTLPSLEGMDPLPEEVGGPRDHRAPADRPLGATSNGRAEHHGGIR
jgi:hypothetical protein